MDNLTKLKRSTRRSTIIVSTFTIVVVASVAVSFTVFNSRALSDLDAIELKKSNAEKSIDAQQVKIARSEEKFLRDKKLFDQKVVEMKRLKDSLSSIEPNTVYLDRPNQTTKGTEMVPLSARADIIEQAENWFYSRYDSTMLSQRTFKFEHLLEQFDDSTDIYDVLQPIKMITMVQIKKQGGNLPKNQIVLFQFSIQDNYEMVGSEWIED